MLIKEVAAEFGERVRVVIEDYGNSPTAARFGVRRYPVVFVDDMLMARPKDFGFKGPEDVSAGLYTPWREPANQARFKNDLRRVVERRLKGEFVAGLSVNDVTASLADGPETLPRVALLDVEGAPLDGAFLDGRAVVVELWATWCPPCRATMAWLKTAQAKYGDRLAVLAIAVDSKPEDVRAFLRDLKPPYSVAIGTPEVLEAFGQVAAVPKLFVFDRTGRRVNVFYGAPPDLHDRLDAAIARGVGVRSLPLGGR